MIQRALILILFFTIISCNEDKDINHSINNNHSINKYIKIDKIINTGFIFDGRQREFKFAVYDNQIFLNPKLSNNGLVMKVFDMTKNNFGINYFQLNKSIDDTLEYYSSPDDIEVNQRNICALFGNYLLVIDRSNPVNTYLTNLNEPFQKIKLLDDKVILCRAYNYHPKSTNIPIKIIKYDLKTKVITNIVTPKSDAIEFSHFTPYNWIDVTQFGEIVFTNTLSPEHFLYDNKLAFEQKLIYRPDNWKNIAMSDLMQLRNSKYRILPHNLIKGLLKTVNYGGCRVITVNFANDSTLLVFYSAPTKNEISNFVRYCNIWKKRNDKWTLFDKELKDSKPDSTTKLSRNNFPFEGSLHTVKYYKNKAYYIDLSPNEDKLLQYGKPFCNIKKVMSKFYSEDKLYNQLFIYNCRF